jgi:hypothetical protein
MNTLMEMEEEKETKLESAKHGPSLGSTSYQPLKNLAKRFRNTS